MVVKTLTVSGAIEELKISGEKDIDLAVPIMGVKEDDSRITLKSNFIDINGLERLIEFKKRFKYITPIIVGKREEMSKKEEKEISCITEAYSNKQELMDSANEIFKNIQSKKFKKEAGQKITRLEKNLENMTNMIIQNPQLLLQMYSLRDISEDYTYSHCVECAFTNIFLITRAEPMKYILKKRGYNITRENVVSTSVNAGIGGLLHDLGKIDEEIVDIFKKGRKWTEEDHKKKRLHPVKAYDLMKLVNDNYRHNLPFKSSVIRMAFGHHRLFHEISNNGDSTGYPESKEDGKTFDPDQAMRKQPTIMEQLMMISDIYTAASANRFYNNQKSTEAEILYDMKEGKNKPKNNKVWFDPALAYYFFSIFQPQKPGDYVKFEKSGKQYPGIIVSNNPEHPFQPRVRVGKTNEIIDLAKHFSAKVIHNIKQDGQNIDAYYDNPRPIIK